MQQEKDEEIFLTIHLNDRIQPLDRWIKYEDPLDKFLSENNYGEVSGWGTLVHENGEIIHCDVELKIKSDYLSDWLFIPHLLKKLQDIGAPKGSKIIIESTEETIEFGTKEGIAIYLDGINLTAEVYKNCDSNFVMEEFERLTYQESDIHRYWQGPKETAFYLYGESYESMKNSLMDFINNYPLCKWARFEKIA